MMMEEELQLLRKRAEAKFIEDRMAATQWVDQLLANMKEMDPALIAHIEMPEGETAKEILSELYNTPFNEEAYKAQIEKVNKAQKQLDDVANRMNENILAELKRREENGSKG